MQYFKHDTSASFDEKLIELRNSCNSFAIEFYYYVLETIYKYEKPLRILNANALQTHASIFHVSKKKAQQAIDKMLDIGLLKIDVNDKECVYSERAMEEIEQYQATSEKRRKAANTRWSKSNANANANAMQEQCYIDKKRKEEKKNSALNGSYSSFRSDVEKRADRASYGEQHDRAYSLPVCPKCSGMLTISKSGFHCAKCNTTFKQNEIEYTEATS